MQNVTLFVYIYFFKYVLYIQHKNNSRVSHNIHICSFKDLSIIRVQKRFLEIDFNKLNVVYCMVLIRQRAPKTNKKNKQTNKTSKLYRNAFSTENAT